MLAAVLDRDPNGALPAGRRRRPPSAAPLSREGPKQRLRDIGDARAELDPATSRRSAPPAVPASRPAARGSAQSEWPLALLLGVAIGRLLPRAAAECRGPVSFEVGCRFPTVTIAQDRSRIALRTSGNRLHIRELRSRTLGRCREAKGYYTILSPDSSARRLRRTGEALWPVSLAGGPPTLISNLRRRTRYQMPAARADRRPYSLRDRNYHFFECRAAERRSSRRGGRRTKPR